MSNVVVFLPKANLNASSNLQKFVQLCREQLTVFGSDLNFDSDSWEVSKYIGLKAVGEKKTRLIFSTHSDRNSGSTPMSEPFRSFAKAYVRYQHGMRPTKVVGFRISALRVLEHVLASNGKAADLAACTSNTFKLAAKVISSDFEPSTANKIGGQLEILAKFIASMRLTAANVNWKNDIPRVGSRNRIGEEHDRAREELMPSSEVLEALPKAFRLAEEVTDILITSIVAILVSAPDRINEVLLLPEQCEVNEDGVFGVRWWPAKGAKPMTKWIVSSMADVVKEAISRIRKCSAQARVIAHWYEQNPTQLYLSPDLNHLRNETYLNMLQVATIIFGNANVKGAGKQWCKGKRIEIENRDGTDFAKFTDVENAVLSALPAGFPILNAETGLKYSEALVVIQTNQMHATRGTWACMIEGMSIDKCNERLGTGSTNGKKSVFERLGLVSSDGSILKVTTHAFRHWLNTIAQVGGLNEVDIAKWSGRADISQNAAYDHTTPTQRAERIRQIVTSRSSPLAGSLAIVPRYIPIHRDSFDRLRIPTAHTTDFGLCIHDYTMTPCQLHADCINCNEQICIKGDKLRMENARKALQEAESMLKWAEEERPKGYAGNEIWISHQQKTVEHLRQLCEIYDDPSVSENAIIKLAIPEVPSKLTRAFPEPIRLSPGDPEEEKVDSEMDVMRRLLGR